MTDLPKTVTAMQLGEGKLVYDPPATGSGTDFATFEFKVHDGTVQSTASAAMSIDVVTQASVCAGPDLTGRRQIWTGELTVGTIEIAPGAGTDSHGFTRFHDVGEPFRHDVRTRREQLYNRKCHSGSFSRPRCTTN